ncbi:MAG: hypothetical protein ACOYM3_30155 [Terrimicrobiaceae bacterium]
MKTTLDLPDDLLIEAKAVAARRRTTLKAMVEHSLRREIGALSPSPTSESVTERNARGFPVIKRSGGKPVTSEMVYALLDEDASQS